MPGCQAEIFVGSVLGLPTLHSLFPVTGNWGFPTLSTSLTLSHFSILPFLALSLFDPLNTSCNLSKRGSLPYLSLSLPHTHHSHAPSLHYVSLLLIVLLILHNALVFPDHLFLSRLLLCGVCEAGDFFV